MQICSSLRVLHMFCVLVSDDLSVIRPSRRLSECLVLKRNNKSPLIMVNLYKSLIRPHGILFRYQAGIVFRHGLHTMSRIEYIETHSTSFHQVN